MWFTYKIVQSTARHHGKLYDTWTVVQYKNTNGLNVVGEPVVVVKCMGGDKHWLSEELAEFALHGYEKGRFQHGGVASAIEAAWQFEKVSA